MNRKLTSISIIGVKLWNQLDANVHNVKTTTKFKHINMNMSISSYDWSRCWDMSVIIFTVEIEHILYNMYSKMVIATVRNHYKIKLYLSWIWLILF